MSFGHQPFDFAHVALARAGAFAHAETQFAIFDFGEFDPAHAQADAPVVPRDPLDAGKRRHPVPRFRPVGSGPAAGLQAGVQIAAVGGVHARHMAFRGVAEQLETGGVGIEAGEAVRG